MIKKLIASILVGTLLFSLTACGGGKNNKVVIYSSSEEYRNEHVLKQLKSEFPDYDITLQYIATGKNAAKIKSEGKKTEADIVLGLETGYLSSLSDVLADVSEYDTSKYIDDVVDPNKKYLAWEKFGGAIIINKKTLSDKGLTVPTSYQDLLKPEYKGLISMPNPKSSGTGFMFLRNLVNTMGEDEAFAYFDQLSKNILQFTSSGSGPVNALVQGEAAIGLGMMFQAVQEINNGVDLEILTFAEGAPYSLGGMAMIDGKQDNPAVKEVFDYIATKIIYEDKELFSPEQIFKDQVSGMQNFPQNIKYADMTGLNDLTEKERLLEKWNY